MLKAITLLQPWATLVARRAVSYELRDYQVIYRGPIAIHAGTKLTGIDAAEGDERIEAALTALGLRLDALPLGGIVGVGELSGCLRTRDVAPDVKSSDLLLATRQGQHALQFERMRHLERPMPAVGRGLLWSVPHDAEAHLRTLLDPQIGAPRYVKAGTIGAAAT
jgi:activating signal cointegrator 1